MRKSERIAQLEDEVDDLRVRLAELRGRISALEASPDVIVLRESTGFGGTYPKVQPQIVTKGADSAPAPIPFPEPPVDTRWFG